MSKESARVALTISGRLDNEISSLAKANRNDKPQETRELLELGVAVKKLLQEPGTTLSFQRPGQPSQQIVFVGMNVTGNPQENNPDIDKPHSR